MSQTVALGVVLMIGAILSTMCFASAAGETRFVVAGGVMFTGVVLIVVGLLRRPRR